jgi:hypothetical protein
MSRVGIAAQRVLGRALVVTFVMAVRLVVVAPPMQAQESPDTTTVGSGGGQFEGIVESDDDLSAEVTYNQLVATPGGGPSGGGGGGPVTPVRPRTCEVHAAPGGPDGGGSENDALTPVSGDLVEGDWYYQSCRYDDSGGLAYSGYWQYTPADPVNPGPDLAALARQAYDQVPFGFPVPVTSPGIEMDQITGFPTWLWIDPAAWRPLSAHAEVAGFWVEVKAQPQRVRWDMGDGTVVACDGPGTPYDFGVPDDAQRTDCQHVYQVVSADEPGGQYTASATVVWSVTWEASTGASDVLADASRTTTFGMTVTERQAVVTYDP